MKINENGITRDMTEAEIAEMEEIAKTHQKKRLVIRKD